MLGSCLKDRCSDSAYKYRSINAFARFEDLQKFLCDQAKNYSSERTKYMYFGGRFATLFAVSSQTDRFAANALLDAMLDTVNR